MKYGIREICDVVLKAKAKMVVGNKIFYKDEPVIYFDSLKTSTMEGAATTVYAQGGRGNSRLVAWEGERTVTFTMEDALISTAGLAILTGADVMEATSDNKIVQHMTEIISVNITKGTSMPALTLNQPAYKDGVNDSVYVMLLDENGNPASEPYIYTAANKTVISAKRSTDKSVMAAKAVLVDYYTERTSGATQIDITPDKFGGNFYLEASTLFRDTNGVDMPAEFIIPNCKVQSNFTFTMASSGDPSTFTFTMDAFPDYTRWNKEKKVLSAIQIITEAEENENKVRQKTDAFTDNNANGKVDEGEEELFSAKEIKLYGPAGKLVSKNGYTNQVQLGQIMTFTTQDNIMCDWDLSACIEQLNDGHIVDITGNPTPDDPVVRNCSSISFRIGDAYDEEEIHMTITPVDSTQGVATEYRNIMFVWSQRNVTMLDDTTLEEMTFSVPDGFTWRQYKHHPSFTPDFYNISGVYVVDLYGSNITLQGESVEADDPIVANGVYRYHFDNN